VRWSDPGGRVIGINVAYIPPQGGAVSLEFAIPAPLVVDVADKLLLTDGHVEHAFLGVTLTPPLADRFGINANGGELVLGVQPGGPADVAGSRGVTSLSASATKTWWSWATCSPRSGAATP
jgi:S1-C subfamily serine protease